MTLEEDGNTDGFSATNREAQERSAAGRFGPALRREHRPYTARGRRSVRRKELRARLDPRHRGPRANHLPPHLLLPAQQGRVAVPDLAAGVRGTAEARRGGIAGSGG